MANNSTTQHMKHVRFADTSVMNTSVGPVKVHTKVNDGLRPESDLFNRLILSFFANGGTVGDHLPKHPRLLYVDRTQDLLRRMKSGKTLVLPHGGGRGAKVSCAHRPYLEQLLNWLVKAAPKKGSREWMLEQTKSCSLLSRDGAAFIMEIVDGLIPPSIA